MNIKQPSAIARLIAYHVGPDSDLVYKQRNEYGHTWYWMSLARPGVIKEHKLKLNTIQYQLITFKTWDSAQCMQ